MQHHCNMQEEAHRGSPGGSALKESWLKGREAWREGDLAIPLVFVGRAHEVWTGENELSIPP